jgi:hypothetical protein
MRVYLTTTIATADAIFRDGWADLHQHCGTAGVHLADVPLSANEGFPGPLTLCLDVPEELFRQHEQVEEIGYRYAVVPAEALNRLSVRPQVYDHEFAGCSRVQMVRSIREREQAGSADYPSAQDMRDAIAFFDRIDWLTPVKLSKQAQQE